MTTYVYRATALAAGLARSLAGAAGSLCAQGPAVATVAVVPATARVEVGGSVALTATLRDHAGRVLTGRTVTWTSRNPRVATVSAGGVVTGVAALGTATITAAVDRQAGTALITVVLPTPLIRAERARPPIRGFADTHSHQFANLAFGGLLLWGKAYTLVGATPEQQLADALPWCDFIRLPGVPFPVAAHGAGGLNDNIGNIMAGSVGHLVGGYPQFDGWPKYSSFTHQQMYIDWLERAVGGGLKLLVVHAVNNEVLCGIANRILSCNDMEAVDRQIAAARELEKLIDDRSGGPGRGWYRIVRTGREARDAISRGKLAVVLGIEVDNLFNCRAAGTCTPKTVQLLLQRYYDLGVRHLIPIHLANNGFGGAAMYEDWFNFNNRSLTGSFFDAWDCSSTGIQYHTSTAMNSLALLLSGGSAAPSYVSLAQCNALGLTPLGEFLIREMMRLGMIVDIDHMSLRAVNRALAIADSLNYPVVAGHTGFLAVSIGNKRAEGQRTPAQLAAIRRLGGLVSPILHQGTAEEISAWGTKVPNDCNTSSKSWAQAYLYAVDAMGGRDVAAVGLGSDFNGLAGEPAPRFGADGCDHDKAQQAVQSRRVTYPFTALATGVSLQPMRSGDRVFVYDVDGVSNVGLLPEFVQDLRNIGLDSLDLAPLLRSAEAYVAMWERIDARTVHP